MSFERHQFYTRHGHEVVVVVERGIASAAVENSEVVGQQIFLVGPQIRKGFPPKLNSDLPLGRDRAGRQAALDREQLRVGRDLFQPKRRFPLSNFNLRFGVTMPVDENIGRGEGGAIGVDSVAVFEIALDFKIELLGEFAG